MAMELSQARQVAAQLAAGMLASDTYALSKDVEKDADFAVTLFQTIVNKLHPPGTLSTGVGPLRM